MMVSFIIIIIFSKDFGSRTGWGVDIKLRWTCLAMVRDDLDRFSPDASEKGRVTEACY